VTRLLLGIVAGAILGVFVDDYLTGRRMKRFWAKRS
jgi:hypothetical protein